MQTDVIESLTARIRAKWKSFKTPCLPEVTTAASLTHHGLLCSVEWMRLEDVDLASVPAEHLASLAACATEYVGIRNVSNTDLVSILDSSKSELLYIDNQSLSTEETRGLVQAMENVEKVYLGYYGNVTLDINTLVNYSGRGKCEKVIFYKNTAVKYREEVQRWARRISWRVTSDDSSGIIIERK